MLKCPSCGEEHNDEANFCRNCATKLRKVCNCWVLDKSFDCGFDDGCPGYRLPAILLRRKRVVESGATKVDSEFQ